MNLPPHRESGTVATISGVATVLAAALFCMYAEAFTWGMSRGTLLDFSLTPVAYPTPLASWTFVLAEGLACAAFAVWLVRETASDYRGARLKSATVTSIAIIVVAIISQMTIPSEWSLQAVPLWQRGGHFIATSSAFVMLTAFLFVWNLSKRPQQVASEPAAS